MNGRARKTLIFFYEGGRKRAATNKKELGKFIRQAFSYTTPNQNHTHAMTKATIRAAAALAVLTALWANVADAAQFNYEVAKSTEDAVRNFMKPPVDINRLTANGFKLGALKLSDLPAYRLDQFTKLVSYPTTYMVYAGFENGFFNGYIRSGDSYKYTEAPVRPINSPIKEARKYYAANTETGAIDWKITRNRTYDHRNRTWYKEAMAAEGKSIWSSIYGFSSTNALGLTHCAPVTDNGGQKGILAVDYTLSSINTFLVNANKNTDRIVFLVEHATKEMVASSTGDLTSTRVKAVESENKVIMSVAKFLDKEGWKETGDQAFLKNDGHAIQVKKYKDSTLDWDIVVTMPVNKISSAICESKNGEFDVATLVLGILTLLGVLALLGNSMMSNNQRARQSTANPIIAMTKV